MVRSGERFCVKTNLADDLRQPRLGLAHAVLGLHLRGVEIGPQLEGDRDCEVAVGRRR